MHDCDGTIHDPEINGQTGTSGLRDLDYLPNLVLALGRDVELFGRLDLIHSLGRGRETRQQSRSGIFRRSRDTQKEGSCGGGAGQPNLCL